MADRPYVGDRIEMPFAGADTEIIVDSIASSQPLESVGIIVFFDQYGQEHLTEKDADTWVTVSVDHLTDEQRATYTASELAAPGAH